MPYRPPPPAPPPSKPPRERRPIAVALHYDPSERSALPTVVASGRGTIADRIVQLAFENGVKVREDADLAELLAVLDLDSEIPAEAIVAVAEILAYLYTVNSVALPPPRSGEEQP